LNRFMVDRARAQVVEKAPRQRGRVQSVTRSIDILMALRGEPLPLADIALATNLPKATASRLLSTLAYRGLAVKDPATGRHMLGPGLLGLAQGVTRGGELVASLAKPGLVMLRERIDETITLHVRAGIEAICVEELRGQFPLSFSILVGTATPLHAGASGKVLIAFMEPAEQARLLRALRLFPITARTTTHLDALKSELEQIRKRGWGLTVGEHNDGSTALSVPVRGPHGILLAISIAGPEARLPRKRLLTHLSDLQSAANVIEKALSQGAHDGV
jgi:DNA-binding IclR family transcriptional regulator